MAPVTVLAFWWSGMYRGSWRVAGLEDLTRCCRAVAMVTVVGAALSWVLTDNPHPLSLFAVYGIVSLLLTGSLRASYVVLESTRLRASHQGRPVLVYGAGASGVAAVRELFQNAASGLRPIGFVDDDVMKRGRLVNGLPVFGTARDLAGIIRAQGAEAVLVASGRIPDERIERAGFACREAGARLFRIDIKVEHLSGGATDDQGALSEPSQPQPSTRSQLPPLPQPSRTAKAAVPSVPAPALSLKGAPSCPSCHGHDVHRSNARNLSEKFRRAQTPKRLFRCHGCGWRGWLPPVDAWRSSIDYDMDGIDLSGLDSRLNAAPLRRSSGDR